MLESVLKGPLYFTGTIEISLVPLKAYSVRYKLSIPNVTEH